MKSIKKEGLRFLIVGGINTLLTYLIYLILLNILGYALAFTVSFAIGIIIAFFGYSIFVFRIKVKWHKSIQFLLIYGIQYILGLLFLSFLIKSSQIDDRIAPIINVAILTPITFILNRIFLVGKVE